MYALTCSTDAALSLLRVTRTVACCRFCRSATLLVSTALTVARGVCAWIQDWIRLTMAAVLICVTPGTVT